MSFNGARESIKCEQNEGKAVLGRGDFQYRYLLGDAMNELSGA